MRIRRRFAFIAALVFLSVSGPLSAQELEKRIALVVGESAYAAGPLPTAANDAGLVAQTLQSAGFDVKMLRELIRIRKQEAAEVEEQETLLDVYRRALGM